MRRKVVILIGIFALLIGINMQITALSPNKDIKSDHNIKAEPPLDQWMPDKNMQQSLVTVMGLSDISELTQERLSHFTNHILLDSSGIKDISGLEYATSTSRIDINQNQISDLRPLSRLTQLRYLGVCFNKISDVSPLRKLTQIRELNIWSNQIGDVSPLSGMKKLERLLINHNQISELDPLSGLQNLQYLYLDDNQINNLIPLSGLTQLRYLGLSDNKVSDLKPLSGMKSLASLHLDNNKVNDLSPLAGMVQLTDVSVRNQSITNKELIGYVGYKTGQKNNIINIDKSKVDLIPSSGPGKYDKATKTINWTYTTTGEKSAISTFNIKLNNDQVFSGGIVQPIKVKVDLTSIEVKDSEISVNDAWKAKDNFVSATNQDGEAIGIEGIKVEGRVNTSRAGIYKITYTILNNAGAKISKEASIQVKANAHDDKHPGDKDNKLPKTGYDISIIGYLLGIAGVLGAGSLYLNRKQ